jgi:hypothetical protein
MRPVLPPSLASHLDAFVTAWKQLAPPRLEDFLPPESEPGRGKVPVPFVVRYQRDNVSPQVKLGKAASEKHDKLRK